MEHYWNSSSNNSWPIHADHKFHSLSAEEIGGVEKFVFFTGYPRSGHSIIGSFLDAHPNIVLSYAFHLFRGLIKKPSEEGSIEDLLQSKALFFNDLYKRSYQYSLKAFRMKNKGYTLDVPGLWSGTFDSSGLKVIGDKSAMPTTIAYLESSESWFKQQYNHLGESVGVPLVGIHVVRNPFDMIATHTMYRAFDSSWKQADVGKWIIKPKFNHTKMPWTPKKQLKNESLLGQVVDFFLEKARAAHEMVPLCGMNVLEVHNEDFVMEPGRELQRLCTFLNVECTEKYLETCESKTYKKISRTRDLVYWPPHLKAKVEDSIKKYPFFRGYTFEDDFYHHDS